MASISARRVGNSWKWSLSYRPHSKRLSLSFTLRDSPQHSHTSSLRHAESQFQPHSRAFSSRAASYQEARPAPTSNATSNAAAATSKYTPSNASRPGTAFKPQETRPSTARHAAANSPMDPLPETPRDPFTSPINTPHIQPGSDMAESASFKPDNQVDWAQSFHGLSTTPFPKEVADVLLAPIDPKDIEIKTDGILYLPEIKYRRILNRAFGPGGWGLAPRSETTVTSRAVTREYALLAHGRLVSIARGEQDYFDTHGIATATEGCKSNALMRCCKDLGVASELWDPRFIKSWLAEYTKEVWVENVVTKKKKKTMLRKDDKVKYPFKETSG